MRWSSRELSQGSTVDRWTGDPPDVIVENVKMTRFPTGEVDWRPTEQR